MDSGWGCLGEAVHEKVIAPKGGRGEIAPLAPPWLRQCPRPRAAPPQKSGEKSTVKFFLFFLQVAFLFDPEMLRVENLNYSSERTILYQRLTVILTDLVFAAGARKTANSLWRVKSSSSSGPAPSKEAVLVLLLVCNSGLFIVDHIHFQYNGFLFGILLLSVGAVLEGSFLTGGNFEFEMCRISG